MSMRSLIKNILKDLYAAVKAGDICWSENLSAPYQMNNYEYGFSYNDILFKFTSKDFLRCSWRNEDVPWPSITEIVFDSYSMPIIKKFYTYFEKQREQERQKEERIKEEKEFRSFLKKLGKIKE